MASDAPENAEQPLGSQTQPTEQPEAIAPPAEPRVASRKDTSLREFLHRIDDYAPIVRVSPSPHNHLLMT